MTARVQVSRGRGERRRRRAVAWVSFSVLLGMSAAASAEHAGGTSGAAAPNGRSAPPTSRQLGRGPSMYETGRVGTMTVQEQGVKIRQTSARAQPPREHRIDSKTSAPQAPAPSGGRIIDQAAFERDLSGRLARLRACKLEVARQRRTTPGALAGSRLTLRWTILSDGHVADTRVVAVARVNGHVVDCIKREMSLWAFDPPRGGPVVVERPFRFVP